MAAESERSVKRALSLLQCFDLDTPALTLQELTKKLGLSPSTTLRLAATLVDLGFLEKTRAKAYSLGNQVYLMGAVARAHFNLEREVLPYMLTVRDACKEAVSLYGMEGGYRVCYQHVESLSTMRCVVRVGDRFPIWAGAAGKCLLAYTDPAVVEREIAKALRITDTTIIDRERFLAELADVRRKNGEAVSYGEREAGVVAMAVPVWEGKERVAYALSIAAPASRVNDEILRRFYALSWTAAAAIERRLFP